MWVKLMFVVPSPYTVGKQFLPFTFDATTSAENPSGLVKGRDLFYTLSPPDGTMNSYRFCINHQNQDPNYFFGTYAQLRNTWKHITIVDRETTATIYTDGIKQLKNGNSIFTYQSGTRRPSNTSVFKIMSRGIIPTGTILEDTYGGTICYVDDYRIYDTMLTDAEIMNIYQYENYNF
jgi:hypothetical protein